MKKIMVSGIIALLVITSLLLSRFAALAAGEDDIEPNSCQSILEAVKANFGRNCNNAAYNSVADLNKE